MKTIKEYFDEYIENIPDKLPEKLLQKIEETFYIGFISCFEHIMNIIITETGENILLETNALKKEITDFIKTKFPDLDKENK